MGKNRGTRWLYLATALMAVTACVADPTPGVRADQLTGTRSATPHAAGSASAAMASTGHADHSSGGGLSTPDTTEPTTSSTTPTPTQGEHTDPTTSTQPQTTETETTETETTGPETTETTPTGTKPTTTGPTKTTTGPTGTKPTTGPSTTTADPATQEAKDKRAIEKVWLQFWKVYIGSTDYTAAELKIAITKVAVDPLKGDIIKQAKYFHDNGLENYGTVINKPFWTGEAEVFDLGIDGSTAFIGDCTNQSKFGSMDAKTKKKRTVGVADDFAVGEFVRDPKGTWKLKQLYYLTQTEC